MKEKEFEHLLRELSRCTRCTNFKNHEKSLINIYRNYDFCTNIPSIWTDWFHRLDSQVMIVGQDWGPYQEMRKFHELLKNDKSNWEELIESEKSLTKKKLEKYIAESSNFKYSLDKAYITNAILCARQGKEYRGQNISLNESTTNCSNYLLRQIQIVNPRVILTLGYYPLKSLSEIFDFEILNTLKETIEKYPEFKVEDYIIIPLYHPAAQISNEEQLERYKKIWEYVDI